MLATSYAAGEIIPGPPQCGMMMSVTSRSTGAFDFIASANSRSASSPFAATSTGIRRFQGCGATAANRGLVLDEQQRLRRPSESRGWLDGLFCCWNGNNSPRKIDFENCPLAKRRVDSVWPLLCFTMPYVVDRPSPVPFPLPSW